MSRQYLGFIEKHILTRLIEIADRRGLYPSSVRYEEGDGVKFQPRAINEHHIGTILDAIGATGLSWLTFRHKDDQRQHSTWLLVIGNGEDVIADHTVGELCNSMFEYAIREVAA